LKNIVSVVVVVVVVVVEVVEEEERIRAEKGRDQEIYYLLIIHD
jgi:hypothetical protein